MHPQYCRTLTCVMAVCSIYKPKSWRPNMSPKITIADICRHTYPNTNQGLDVRHDCCLGRGQVSGGQMSDHTCCLGIRVCVDKKAVLNGHIFTKHLQILGTSSSRLSIWAKFTPGLSRGLRPPIQKSKQMQCWSERQRVVAVRTSHLLVAPSCDCI